MILIIHRNEKWNNIYKASQAIQPPRTVPFFLLISLLDGYLFADVHVKGIKHLNVWNKTVPLSKICSYKAFVWSYIKISLNMRRPEQWKKFSSNSNFDLDFSPIMLKHKLIQGVARPKICMT